MFPNNATSVMHKKQFKYWKSEWIIQTPEFNVLKSSQNRGVIWLLIIHRVYQNKSISACPRSLVHFCEVSRNKICIILLGHTALRTFSAYAMWCSNFLRNLPSYTYLGMYYYTTTQAGTIQYTLYSGCVVVMYIHKPTS